MKFSTEKSITVKRCVMQISTVKLSTGKSSTEQFSSEHCSTEKYCPMEMFITEYKRTMKCCADQLSEVN